MGGRGWGALDSWNVDWWLEVRERVKGTIFYGIYGMEYMEWNMFRNSASNVLKMFLNIIGTF